MTTPRLMGAEVKRKEDPRLVTGTSAYVADLPLPAVTDSFAALADGAPQLFDDAPRNVEHENTIRAGDPDAAFARARRVVRQRMVSQRLCGVPMEPRATLAAPD